MRMCGREVDDLTFSPLPLEWWIYHLPYVILADAHFLQMNLRPSPCYMGIVLWQLSTWWMYSKLTFTYPLLESRKEWWEEKNICHHLCFFSSHNSPLADHDTQNHDGRLEEAQAFNSPSTMGMLNYLAPGTSVCVSNKLWIQCSIHHHILATLPRGYVSLIKSVLVFTHCH